MSVMKPLPAAEVLDRYYLEARARLLEVAAILDRIDRGGTSTDPRMKLIHQAITMLNSPQPQPNRAAELQRIFSLPYQEGWLKDLRPS